MGGKSVLKTGGYRSGGKPSFKIRDCVSMLHGTRWGSDTDGRKP